jgi:hypothetical protein
MKTTCSKEKGDTKEAEETGIWHCLGLKKMSILDA